MKRVSQPFLSDWETGIIIGISYCFVIFAVYWLSGHMEPVFCGKRKRWYVILALPLIMIITVFDVADWGASHGIMVRSGGGQHRGIFMAKFSVTLNFWFLHYCLCLRLGFICLG